MGECVECGCYEYEPADPENDYSACTCGHTMEEHEKL